MQLSSQSHPRNRHMHLLAQQTALQHTSTILRASCRVTGFKHTQTSSSRQFKRLPLLKRTASLIIGHWSARSLERDSPPLGRTLTHQRDLKGQRVGKASLDKRQLSLRGSYRLRLSEMGAQPIPKLKQSWITSLFMNKATLSIDKSCQSWIIWSRNTRMKTKTVQKTLTSFRRGWNRHREDCWCMDRSRWAMSTYQLGWGPQTSNKQGITLVLSE